MIRQGHERKPGGTGGLHAVDSHDSNRVRSGRLSSRARSRGIGVRLHSQSALVGSDDPDNRRIRDHVPHDPVGETARSNRGAGQPRPACAFFRDCRGGLYGRDAMPGCHLSALRQKDRRQRARAQVGLRRLIHAQHMQEKQRAGKLDRGGTDTPCFLARRNEPVTVTHHSLV